MRQVCLLVFLSFCVSFQLFGQDRASIEGTLSDPSGSTVSNADVELLFPATGLTRHSITTAAGTYRFESLAVGTYKMTVAKPGF